MALANARSDLDLLYRRLRTSAALELHPSIKLEKPSSSAGLTWPYRDTQTRLHPFVNLTIALHEKPSVGRLSCLTTRARAHTSGTACHRAGKREGSPRCSLRELDAVSDRRSLCLTLYFYPSCLSASSPATEAAGCFMTILRVLIESRRCQCARPALGTPARSALVEKLGIQLSP
jgi:hypothetical protein